jgi:glutathione S-transferase
MISLYGFAASNYYNKVKLVLLEKGLAFEEHLLHPRNPDAAALEASPLGKVPFVRSAAGTLCESQVICEWLEAAHPQPALLPSDAFAAAKVRELCAFVDLHLELVARELYGKAFFGGEISDKQSERVRKLLGRHIPAFLRLAKFSPYVAGETFTLADACAWASLPLVGMATKAVYGEDMLLAHGLDIKPYMALVNQRPSAQKVVADRKAAQAASAAAAAANPATTS